MRENSLPGHNGELWKKQLSDKKGRDIQRNGVGKPPFSDPSSVPCPAQFQGIAISPSSVSPSNTPNRLPTTLTQCPRRRRRAATTSGSIPSMSLSPSLVSASHATAICEKLTARARSMLSSPRLRRQRSAAVAAAAASRADSAATAEELAKSRPRQSLRVPRGMLEPIWSNATKGQRVRSNKRRKKRTAAIKGREWMCFMSKSVMVTKTLSPVK